MPIFESIVYSLVIALSEIFPVSAQAHIEWVSKALGWNTPSSSFLGLATLGSAAGILVAFRHDWASVVSSFLQVLLFRKKPRTFDERLPFFLMATSLPIILMHFYLKDWVNEFFRDPTWIFLGLTLTAFLFFAVEVTNRKTRGMFDWGIADATLMGLGQVAELIPGVGRSAGALLMGLSRNYHRNVVVKFHIYAALPVLIYLGIYHLKGQHVVREIGRLQSYAVFILTALVAGVAAHSFVKNSEYRKLNGIAYYRLGFSAALGVIYFLKARGTL